MALVISRLDGGITVFRGFSEDNPESILAIAQWKESSQGQYVTHRYMPDSSIPTDRQFRDSWCDTTPDPVVDIDMPKARQIHMDRIRRKRDELLLASDAEMVKVQDIGSPADVAKLKADRQALRNTPQVYKPQIDDAQDVIALRAIWPPELER